MDKQFDSRGFIPKFGGYKSLLTYQKAEIIYDGTVYFCRRFFKPYDRTTDQMIQAARSGKQNIVEGSMASGLSKETELKLTNVARASLEELLNDYKDFLRTNHLIYWDKNHQYYPHLTKLITKPNTTYENYRKGIENPNPEVAANVLIALINLTSYLLAKQIQRLEVEFLQHGGLREQMYEARVNINKRKRDD